MRDSKISILLIISFSIVFISMAVLGIWGYQFYNKVDKITTKPVAEKERKENQDSLIKIYTSTIKELERKLGATYDSAGALEDSLNIRLTDYYRLKAEVGGMLVNPKSEEDFTNAKSKIEELQIAMEALRKTNADVTEENKRLYQILSEMKKNQPAKTTSVKIAPPVKTKVETKIPTSVQTKKTTTAPVVRNKVETTPAVSKPNADFTISDIGLEESQNNSLTASFSVKPSAVNNITSDVMVVVISPEGKVIQKSNWESGSFNTEDGKKIYSYKVKIDGSSKDLKKIKFTLPADKATPGNYTIQLYHNGNKIGTSVRDLF